MLISDSRSIVVLAILFGVVVAAIVGVIIWVVTSLSKSQKAASELEEALAIPLPAQEPYLLALRRMATGKWRIYVRDQPVETLEAVPDDNTRKEIVAGLRELATFARGYVQTSQTASPVVPPAATASSGSAAPSPAKALLPLLPSETRGSARRPSVSEPRRSSESTLMPVINLAREISEIVEDMQSGIPSLQHRSIRLKNALDGGVQFEVDGKYYNDLAEIPDAEVRALIQKATQEWERR